MGTIFDWNLTVLRGSAIVPRSRGHSSDPVQLDRVYQPAGERLLDCMAVVLALD